MYGSHEILKALEKRLKTKLSFVSRKPQIFSERTFKFLDRLFNAFSFLKKWFIYQQYQTVRNAYLLFTGKPQNMAHVLTRWRTPQSTVPLGTNPDQGVSGIMWYAPIIPLSDLYIQPAIDMIKQVTRDYGFDPLITLTANNDRYAVATLALCFSRETMDEIQRAQLCYERLCSEGRKLGIFPYRAGTLPIPDIAIENGFPLHRRIKLAVDPHGTFDPSRFPA
jgi:4-cresol dehydrogenase (hydroxylating) flavoprotein subunit